MALQLIAGPVPVVATSQCSRRLVVMALPMAMARLFPWVAVAIARGASSPGRSRIVGNGRRWNLWWS